MVSVKLLFTISTLFAVGFCATIGEYVFFTYQMIPYTVISRLESSWKACPTNTTNSTNQERYRAVLKQVQECAADPSQKNQSLCHKLEANVKKCSQPLEDYFVDCLPDKSKDVPPAITEGVVSIIDAFCTSSGELLLEVANECLHMYPRQKDPAIREECKKKAFQPKLNRFEKEPPSKAEVCQVLGEIGNCWRESVNRVCESQTAKEAFTKLYHAILSPCDT